MKTRAWQFLGAASGQSLIEAAMVTPLLVVIALGVVEVGYALLDQHVVTRLTREGSNLISRDTPLQTAAQVMRGIASRPVNFDNGTSKVIFSVLKRGETTGTANYDRIILYQRYEYGSYGGSSKLATAGGGSFGGPPNYEAANSDNNTGLRVTNVPADLVAVKGGLIYVTEIYTRHSLMTPLNRFGITVPETMYSIAYF
ncbi:MAG: TadE/TadG family type IV pilus assembly protein [Burkholderiales bacterium]